MRKDRPVDQAILAFPVPLQMRPYYEEGRSYAVTFYREDGSKFTEVCRAHLMQLHDRYREERKEEPMAEPLTFEDVRPEVKEFALMMEKRLRFNAFKGDWRGERLPHVLARLESEVEDLALSVEAAGEYGPHTLLDPANKWCGKVRTEAADVANFAAMIYDLCNPGRHQRGERPNQE